MSADYLSDFRDELRKLGDLVWRRAHRTPVLIVLGKTAELVDQTKNKSWNGKTIVATPSGEVRHMALVDRVFAVEKAPHSPRGPIVVGRSDDNDVAIPEYSISKRHCFFEFMPDGTMVTDCGSTNGTFVDSTRIAPHESAPLPDGSTLSLGRFAFRFRTAPGFYAQVKSLLA